MIIYLLIILLISILIYGVLIIHNNEKYITNISLTELADNNNSDKGNKHDGHLYTQIYEKIFHSIKNSPLRILEIGINNSNNSSMPSLQMWSEYFPNAIIHGIDIVDFSHIKIPRIETFICDQSNKQQLLEFSNSQEPYDIIIDDGYHAWYHQQVSLNILFNKVKSGGIYIIEDLHYQPNDNKKYNSTDTRYILHNIKQKDIKLNTVSNLIIDIKKLSRHINHIDFYNSQSKKFPINITKDALAVIYKI